MSFLILLFLLLFLALKLSGSRTDVSITRDGVESEKYGNIKFSEIEDVKMRFNYSGYNTLIILNMNDGRKLSLGVTNKYSGIGNHVFENFKLKFEKVLKDFNAFS